MPMTKTRPYDAGSYLKTEDGGALYLRAALDEFDSNYKALSPEGNPSFATIAKVVEALGLRLHASIAKRRAMQ